jgi:tetratricopeptide (TPR) repeat protein
MIRLGPVLYYRWGAPRASLKHFRVSVITELDSKEKASFQRWKLGLFATLAVVRRLIMEPERRLVRAAIWGVFIVGGALVFARSVPYYCYLHTAQQAEEAGHFEVAQEMLDCALSEANKFERLDSRRAGVLSRKGELYRDECRYPEAAACFEKSLAIKEATKTSARERSDTMLRLGIVYLKEKRFDNARNILNKALKLMLPQKNSQYEIATIKYALAEVDAATGDYAPAANGYDEASAIFLSLQSIDPDLIVSCLKKRIAVLRKLNRPNAIQQVQRQLAQIKVPPAPAHLWFALEHFGYTITEQLLTLSEHDLRNPPQQLTDVASPAALSAIAACAGELAGNASASTVNHSRDRADSPTELQSSDVPADSAAVTIDSVQFAQPSAVGFVPVSVVAHRHSVVQKYRSIDRTFYLRLWLGLGVKTHQPMLAGFHMIGCRAQSNKAPTTVVKQPTVNKQETVKQ